VGEGPLTGGEEQHRPYLGNGRSGRPSVPDGLPTPSWAREPAYLATEQQPAYFDPGNGVDPQPPLGNSSRHRRSPGRGAPWVLIAIAAVVVLALGALVWSRSGGVSNSGSKPKSTAAPIANEKQPTDPDDPFYLVPGGSAARQVATWKADGRDADAAAIQKIAAQPVASWFAYDGADVEAKATTLFQNAEKAGRTPLLVAYFLPHRDCGQYSSGGAKDAAAYRAWIAKLAKTSVGHDGYLILEPDALAHTLDGCLNESQSEERYGLIREAITTLKANSKLKVYLDAGNSAWIASDKMAASLDRAGIEHADGFALNVSNFETTARSISYGEAISGRLGGKHFVIDTSRNGNGPYPNKLEENHWCNPPGRALGTTPTTKTGSPQVDAYLWVKQPGDSDGQCRPGAPAAGSWWADYALTLALGAKD
jgi:endoglucanase